MSLVEPSPDCPLCPRLAEFREENRRRHPDFFNAPVRSFGPAAARLYVIGLAPGLKGANRTGRPFTGDYAGDLLYETLIAFGFAEGVFEARPDDGLTLTDARIVNAVRCVPPENKPTPLEVKTCNVFLASELKEASDLVALLALGRIAHDAIFSALNVRKAAYPFKHGAAHALPNGLLLFDSYHCSRRNTSFGLLTRDMFRAVFAQARNAIDDKGI